ncbi:lipopolysaccharide biosynthesis protein [Marinitoga lauensis]|uniref:lipopolysaccharide biosynthesis protein n=1 Tax=Marinitoga lauensis TaxID=2201189 RepID=UPI00101205F3|nr:hypothetical protein [Marinitoga lauensis]
MRKFFLNSFFNIIATFIPIFVLQFYILPKIALKMDKEYYGQVLALISLINLSVAIFGNVLNNSRLIQSKKYEKLEHKGDFNILLIISIIMDIFFVIIGSIYYGKFLTFYELIIVVIISVLLVLNSYASVEFRIKLNYKKILLNNFLIFIGYMFGYQFFLYTRKWIYIFFFGSFFSFIYILIKTSILKEPFKRTSLFKQTVKETSLLAISGILVSLLTYVDKLIIFPLLGGEELSIYFAASILGKTFSLAANSVVGVLLSYLSNMKSFNNFYFNLLLIISIVFGSIGYFIIILVNKYFLVFLYPQLYEEALKYLNVTTLYIIIRTIGNIMNSIILKFFSAKWQLFINGIDILSYMFLSIYFLKLYGLWGFCLGLLISSFIRLILIIVIFYYNKYNRFDLKNFAPKS